MQQRPDNAEAAQAKAQTSTPLDGALYMAAVHNVPVFPLRPGTKKPYAGEGVSTATTDVLQIMAWADERPGCNFGCATQGFAVLDVDIKHGAGGSDTLDQLCRQHGRLPTTLQIATPSGGLHIWFGGMEVGQSPVGQGIDVRGVGGYTVCEGSVYHGKRYVRTSDAAIAPVPEPWQRLFKRPGEQREKGNKQKQFVEFDTPEALARARAYLESRPGGVKGSRGITAYKIACYLRELGLSEPTAAAEIDSRWAPRCSPPMPTEDVDESTHHAFRYAQNAPGSLHTESDFKGVELDDLEEIAEKSDNAPEAEKPIDPAEQFEAWRTDFAESELQPRPWLVTHLLLRGQLTALVAHPGVGKSSLSLGVAVAIATGNADRIGFSVPASVGAGKVLFLTVEENQAELNSRLWAYCKLHGIDRASLAGRIWVQKDSALSLKLVKSNAATRTRELTDAFKRLALLVAREKIDAIVFDPFVELHDADENDNNAIADVVQAIRGLCRKFGAAGLVVHHTRKGGQNGGSHAGDMHSARGAGALMGAVRIAYTLTYPTDDDAARYAMSAQEKASMIRLDGAKGNYGRRQTEPRWYAFASVRMPYADALDVEGTDDGQYTGALQYVDLRSRQDAELRACFTALREELQSAGPNGLNIEYAAKAAMYHDRATFGSQPAAVAKRLARVFKVAQELNGERIWLEGSGKSASLKWEEAD